MKKLALLFTILFAVALNGMKRSAGEHYVESDMGTELKSEIWGQQQLPEEIKTLIMVTLAQSGDNLDEAIKNIKKVSVLNKTFNQIVNEAYGIDNLQRFTQLVHILADKFGMTTEIVAGKFGTPVAKNYNELGRQLLLNVFLKSSINDLEVLIKKGADVNYSSFQFFMYAVGATPMLYAMKGRNLEAIELLLNTGAKLESDEYYNANDYWPLNEDAKQEIKQLLDEIRVKRQQ